MGATEEAEVTAVVQVRGGVLRLLKVVSLVFFFFFFRMLNVGYITSYFENAHRYKSLGLWGFDKRQIVSQFIAFAY